MFGIRDYKDLDGLKKRAFPYSIPFVIAGIVFCGCIFLFSGIENGAILFVLLLVLAGLAIYSSFRGR